VAALCFVAILRRSYFYIFAFRSADFPALYGLKTKKAQALNLKNALTRAKLSPEGLYATQIVAFWFRVTKRPKWTVCGAGNKTCFLLAAK